MSRVDEKAGATKLPTVAVITALYNHGKWIEDCISSVSEQDYPNKFMVVVDDCSTDGSDKVALELLSDVEVLADGNGRFTRGLYDGLQVYIIKNPKNVKQAASRNNAIRFAWEKADLFGVLDADDTYLTGKLTKSVQAWEQSDRNAGFIYCDVIIHNEASNASFYEAREPFSRARILQECITSNAPLISKRALETVGLYDEEMPPCEDWDLAIRITERFPAIHIAEALQMYRVTGENCTWSVPPEVWQQQWNRIHQKHVQGR